MAIITVSRMEASRGDEVAALVAERTGFRLVDRTVMQELMYSYDLLASLGRAPGPPRGKGASIDEGAVREITEGIIYHLAAHENVLILGFGGQFLFQNCPASFHIRLLASPDYRIARALAAGAGTTLEALDRREQKRRRLVKRYSGADLSMPEHYDMILRMDSLGVTGAAEVVTGAVRTLGWDPAGALAEISDYGRRRGAREIPLDPIPPSAGKKVPFAHPSEAEFAKVLDFYRIRWEYEPRSFPIRWKPDGSVQESFTPDFYLPDLGTFLELTTMKQSLVTRKNRKVRLFRQLYPDKKLSIFYGRDFRRLAQKYGLE